MPKTRKIFVLDSNVILHHSPCIDHFDEHDMVIPIPVIEELDQFKKGDQIINYHVRRFVRELDRLCTDLLPEGRMPLGTGKETLAISLDQDMRPDLRLVFPTVDKSDHRILNIACHALLKHRKHAVILVSKDVNPRMKARAVGRPAEDNTTDHIRGPAHLYSGCQYADDLPAELIGRLYEQEGE